MLNLFASLVCALFPLRYRSLLLRAAVRPSAISFLRDVIFIVIKKNLSHYFLALS
jgi:hypothetical protein